MDAERSTTVDDLVASVKTTAPPPEDDEPRDDAEPAELEPIDTRQLLLFAGPPMVLAAGFGLWLIAWWVPLAALAAALLGFLAWHGKIPGLKGASSGLSGGGKPGWQLGRPRGSSGLLGGSTGRSSGGGRKAGLASALGLGGRKPAAPGGTGKPTMRERARNAARKARETARKATGKVADKARSAVHKATGGRYGKPRTTTATGAKGSGASSASGKGAPSGGGPSSTGGKDTSGGKRTRRNPITALADLVKGRTPTPDKDGDKPEKPRSKDKKKKTKDRDTTPGKDTGKRDDDDTTDDDPDTGDADPEHTGPGTGDGTRKDKPGLLGAYGRLAHKIGDKVRAVDPKALKANLKDALGTPFKGLFTRKPKHDPTDEDTTGKPPAETPPEDKPAKVKPAPDEPAPDKSGRPPGTWDDAPPPPAEDGPEPARRYYDDDPPELPEAEDVPKPRRPPTYDDNPPPVRHAAYREPRETHTHDDWTNTGPPSGTRAHAPSPAPTEEKRRSTTMTVTATGAPITNGSDENSTPHTRAERWERMAEAEDANAKVFSDKAHEFQETIDVLKSRENQTLATEEEMREAEEGKAEAERQAHAHTAAARTLRDKAQEERAQGAR